MNNNAAGQGPLERPVRPTDDAELLAELHAQRERLRNHLSDLQNQINAVRVRISEAKKQERKAGKRPNQSHTKRRSVSMALDAIGGETFAQVARKHGVSTERVRQCISNALRISMHPSHWDVTGGAMHPQTVSAARLRPEPLVSVLRSMLDEA